MKRVFLYTFILISILSFPLYSQFDLWNFELLWEKKSQKVDFRMNPPHLLDSLNIRLIYYWSLGPPSSIAVDSQRLYIGSGGGIIEVDIANPDSPCVLNEDLQFSKEKFAKIISVNDTLFTILHFGKFGIFDYTDAYNPQIISINDIPGATILDIFLRDTLLFISSYYKGFHIFNVKDPANPVEIGFYDTTSSFSSIIPIGNFLHLLKEDSIYSLDITDPTSPVLIGTHSLPFFPSSISFIDTLVFFSESYPGNGIRIYNFSDPSNIYEIGSYNFTDSLPVFSLLAEDTRLYVGKACSLIVFNIFDPSNPQRINAFRPADTSGEIRGIKKSDTLLFLMDYQNGIHIMNISDSLNPYRVSFIRTPGNTYDVGSFFNRLFSVEHRYPPDPFLIRTLRGGMHIFTRDTSYEWFAFYHGDENYFPWRIMVVDKFALLSDPPFVNVYELANPFSGEEIGFFDTPGYAKEVYVSGNYAYVADGYVSGLRIIDVSDLSNLQEAGFYEVDGDAMDVEIDFPYAILVENPFGIRILNISIPSNIVEIANLQTTDPRRGFLDFPYLYLADGIGGLKIISLQNILNPVVIGSLSTSGRAEDVYIYGDLCFVADGSEGLKIIDVSDPSNPSLLSSFPVNNWATGVYATSGYAYLIDYYDGLYILDISNPASPSLISSIDPGSGFTHITKSGSSLFLSTASSIKVVNTAYPEHPYVEATFPLPWDGFGTFIQGNIIYTTCGIYGLRLLKIWEPIIPSYITSNYGMSILDWEKGENDLLYTTGVSLLEIWNIEYPWEPVRLSIITPPNFYFGYGIDIQGDYAYVSEHPQNGNSSFYIIDISDPQNPNIMSSISGGIWDIAVKDTYAYVFTYSGIDIYSVQNPSSPVYITTFFPGHFFPRGEISSGILFTLDLEDQMLRAFDITQDPVSPPEIGYYSIPVGPYSYLKVNGREIYLSAYNTGFRILRYEGPVGIREPVPPGEKILPEIIMPTIFKDNTPRIVYYVPSNSSISLSVFDISGRRLWKFKRDNQKGKCSILLPKFHSGIYFLRAKINSREFNKKIILMR